jgi:hypothetical protein
MITFEIYGVGFELSLGEIDKSKFEYWGTPFLDHLNFKLILIKKETWSHQKALNISICGV